MERSILRKANLHIQCTHLLYYPAERNANKSSNIQRKKVMFRFITPPNLLARALKETGVTNVAFIDVVEQAYVVLGRSTRNLKRETCGVIL